MVSARTKVLLSVTVYVASFHWAYVAILSRVYAYEGFRYNSNQMDVATAWALAILPALWLPSRLSRPSQVAYWILYVLVVVPAVLVTIYSNRTDWSGIFPALSIVSSFGLVSLIYKLPLVVAPRFHLQRYEFWAAILFLSTASYALMAWVFGLHLSVGALSDVYVVRSHYKEGLIQSSPDISYVVGWQAYVLNPMLMALGLLSRRRLLLVAGGLGQLLIFSTTGFRVVLFSAVFLVALLYLLRAPARFGPRIALSVAGAIAGSVSVYLWSGSLVLSSLVVERLTGLPGLLTHYYFSFFSSHPKMLLSHSVLRALVDNPYHSEPPVLIGQLYFRQSGAYANANLWADAYANFGYIGVYAFTALLALVLWTYDSITVGKDLRLAALMLGIPAIALSNAGLLTSLLTHGIAFAFLLMYVIPPGIEQPAAHPCAPRTRAAFNVTPVASN